MRAILRALAVVVGVVILGFVLTRALPGDPVALMVQTPGAGASEAEALRRNLGLDVGLWAQFWAYVHGLFIGDWGQSRVTGRPVLGDIAQRLPASLELALAGVVPAVLACLALGWGLALRPFGFVDRLARGIAALGAALPVFVSGLLLIQVFYGWLDWVPEPSGRLDGMVSAPPRVSGLYTIDAALAGQWGVLSQALGQMILPALTLSLFGLAGMVRVFRAAILQALQGAGARGARAMGLSKSQVLRLYVFPEALGPLIPVVLLTFGYMLGASVLVEKVFAWPGLGRYALEAVGGLDYAAVQGVLLVLALCHVALSLLADWLSVRLDPRVGRRNG